MNVTLKSFCEDIPLADPKNVKSYLVFEQDGVEFRVPVGSDAIQAIAKHIYKVPKPVAFSEPIHGDVAEDPDLAEEAQDPEPTDATVFGDEEEEDPDELPPDDNEDPIGALELKRVVDPDSEDGVPSL